MKLMILDGNSVINRAYYGIRPLTTKDGLYTHAIYGFLNILERMRNEEQPDALCVAFDLHGPTFRHERYDGYKATRHGMDDELAMQMPVMKDVLRAMNIPIYEVQGWEADDVIGTVARLCGEADWDCVIVTGDRDDLQLIDSHVFVKYISSKGGQTNTVLYDEERFRAEYGFEPKHLIDLKSLMGDSSDNIPGVAGVGQKTATDLLLKFGTTEAIYQNIDSDQIRDSVRKKLIAGEESARLSYELATIRTDAPIEFAPEDNLVKPVDKQALYDLFVRLEFVRLIDRYHLREQDEPENAPETVQGECTSEIVTTLERAQELLTEWRASDGVTVLPLDDLSGVACLCGDHMALVLDSLPEYDEFLRGLFGAEIAKTAHGVKTLTHRLLRAGYPAENFVFDTELAAYFLSPSDGSYALEKLTPGYLGFDLAAAPAYDPEKAAEEQPDALGAWFSRCAAIASLRGVFEPKLAEYGMDALYRTVDLPLCRVLAEMECDGVAVDREALVAFGQMLSERIETCQSEIYRYAGGEFNINSTRALGTVLFEQLGLPPVKKTKTGYSTNIDVLEKLRNRHPIVQNVIDYRTLTKLNSTYAEGLLKVIAPDGRIHTTFQNTVTATGRLSSTDPNLQNIPVRTELGSELRRMFVPRPGWVLVDADYSQIELRVLAHIADDKLMQQAFLDGEDIHRATAAQVFGVSPIEVTSEMRRHAKAVNFGIVYGISEFSLAEDIGVSFGEAKAYIASYLDKYQGVQRYMKEIVQTAREQGYVTTLMGRRRYLPDLHSKNFNVRSGAERIALNTPIQGTAADIIKLAMLRVRDALSGMQARLVLQIHDELIVECPQEEAEQVKHIVTEAMEGVMQLAVPLEAEAKIGESWYAAK
jgi:DNA polymerase-1